MPQGSPAPLARNRATSSKGLTYAPNVSSKSQKKRAEKRRRSVNRAVPVSSENLDTLARPLRLIVEGHDRLLRHLNAAGDFASAMESARREFAAAVQRICDVAAPYDVFDVVQSLKLAEATANPETYRETEHEGLAAAIELGAVVLSARGTRQGIAPSSGTQRRRPDGIIEGLQALTREALDAASTLLVVDALAAGTADAQIALSGVLREVFVRNLTYPHMLEATLSGLFDEPSIETDCRATIGCTVAEVRRVIEAIMSLHTGRLDERMLSLRQFAQVTRDAFEEWRAAGGRTVGDPGPMPEVPLETRERARQSWDATWDNPADASIIDVHAIETRTGLPKVVVESAVALLSYDLTPGDPVQAALKFVNGRSPFRTRPVLRDGQGTAMPTHDGLLLPAVRERVEEELKPTASWERYAKHRGQFLESTGLSLLSSLLPGAAVRVSIEYFVPNNNAPSPEVLPSDYTKLVEADGLLLLDDVAIVLEAKSGALGPESRAGNRVRLHGDLRKLVTEGAAQGNRLRDRIKLDKGLVLRDRAWLDLSFIREVHVIALTLEDLSAIAAATVSLIQAGLLAPEDVPWTVSIHDLEIIRDLVDRPAEFLLYLRRRTEPAVTMLYHAVDELDFFLEFFATGLFVERNPEEVRAEMPALGGPSVAELRRFKAQHPEMLTSRTDRLDAWYFHQLGLRQAPAPKPSHNANPVVQELVDHLQKRGEAGWLATGATLLAGSAALQDRIARTPRRIARQTKKDGQSHSYTMLVGLGGPDSALLVWATFDPDSSEDWERARFRSYLRDKQYQANAAVAVCFIIDPNDPRQPIAVIFENEAQVRDAERDQRIETSGLRPLTRSVDRLPLDRKR